MPWSDYYVQHIAPKFTDYSPKPEYSLRTGDNQDGYILQLIDGINWRFSATFPDSGVARAYELAQQEFTDMKITPWDRNAKSNKASIRIRKLDGGHITESDLDDLISRIAKLMLALRNA